MLSVKNISKSYVSHKALDNVSIDINQSSIFGLLGPNGAGKTSLIRIINQIMSPIIFFALLAKNILNYGGKFQISDEKQNIIFIIDENFKFPKINLLTGYFIITWSKINLTFQPNKTNYKMHNVDLATWKYLKKKAFKTYVPESIQSRKLGAGAGLLDND